MNRLKSILSVLFIITMTLLGAQLISKSIENQRYKSDYAELNNFKYGLFSVDAWKKQLSVIISDEIENLSLTKDNEKVIQKQLDLQLKVLIDKVMERIKKYNYNSPQGQLVQGLIHSFIDIEDIKKGTPEYAKAIMAEMKNKKSESQIKGLLKDKVDDYMKKSFDTQDSTFKKNILKRYGSADEAVAKKKVKKIIGRNQRNISELAMIMIIIGIILFVMEAFNKGPLPPSQYLMLTLSLLVLLTVGVTTPMIDMEARISELSFVLLDHKMFFHDQVLYFQSKSILDVFWVMITHHELEMKLVGVLLVSFSILFPLLKMLSSLAYYYDYCEARKYKIIQFFVLKSGKWSMADVLVVAIFMAYIGFNGIINSQLGDLATEGVNIVSTNGTNLQPGYYLFMSYTILAMFLSGYIKSRPYECITKGP
jgi:multisubunit Na+/H+ antiporter MnhG subunit